MSLLQIGVDLDTKNRFNMLKTYFNGLRLGETRVYETNHGFHVKIEKLVNVDENMEARRTLGDDIKRLEIDEKKIDIGLFRFVDTLFTHKKYPDGSTSEEVLIDPLAEQFWGVNSLVY